MAAVKALDQLFSAPPPQAARKLRELLYMAFFVSDHTTHFYALGGPDFIVGPDAKASERNILGVIRKVGLDVGKQVIDCRARNGQVIKTIGGREIHPAAALPGGWSKPLSEDERAQIEAVARKNIDFALFTLQTFDAIVLNNPIYKETIEGNVYLHRTYSMGTVDERNHLNLYDGKIRVVDPEGREFLKYDSTEYASHIAERVEPWTYMKFPYLKDKGWNGFVDGTDSGVYSATPLARLNVADGIATPRAQQEYERFYQAFGKKKVDGRYQPVHHRMATHWARLIELLYASEHMLELATDPEITSPDVRAKIGTITGVGIGSVEAPRGTLTHHYTTDANGILVGVNLIVGTTNNHAAMAMSVERAARELIHGGIASEGLLNRVEMAFRLYDPCMSCATHSLPGTMPLVVNLRNGKADLLQTLRRDE
jgi:F420-non-reducing hydrogenase large subunit